MLDCHWVYHIWYMSWFLSILDTLRQINPNLDVCFNNLLIILTIFYVNENLGLLSWIFFFFWPTIQSLTLAVTLSGLCWRAAAVWSWTAGTDQTMSRWSTTATRSPRRSSSKTRSKPSRSMPLRCAQYPVICSIIKYPLAPCVSLLDLSSLWFPSGRPQTSDYPVILSLENHCSVEQQQVMAHHMSSILGSALVTSPLGDGMPTTFPSPEVCIYSSL